MTVVEVGKTLATVSHVGKGVLPIIDEVMHIDDAREIVKQCVSSRNGKIQ